MEQGDLGNIEKPNRCVRDGLERDETITRSLNDAMGQFARLVRLRCLLDHSMFLAADTSLGIAVESAEAVAVFCIAASLDCNVGGLRSNYMAVA